MPWPPFRQFFSIPAPGKGDPMETRAGRILNPEGLDSPEALYGYEKARWFLVLLFVCFPLVFFDFPYPFGDLSRTGVILVLFPGLQLLWMIVPLVVFAMTRDDYLSFIWICAISSLITFNRIRASFRSRAYSRVLLAWLFDKMSQLFLVIIFFQFLQHFNVMGINAVFLRFFPDMAGLDDLKGFAFFSEPSMLAGPLLLYGVILELHCAFEDEGTRFRAIIRWALTVLTCVALARSLTCALVIIFALTRIFNAAQLLVMGGIFVAPIGLIFSDRLLEAAGTTGNFSVLDFTTALNSWRTIPDAAIIVHYKEYILPGIQAGLRDRIVAQVSVLSPVFAWIQYLYSYFATYVSTFGFLGLFCILISTYRRLASRASAIRDHIYICLLLFAMLFLLPKYDISCWVALGLISLVRQGDAIETPA